MEPFDAPDPQSVFAPPTVSTPPSAPTVEAMVAAEPPRSRAKKGRLFGALAAVAVLAVGGVIVVKNVQSSSGGFDSPEAAVKALFAAAEQEDVLGIVDVMRPGERAMLRDTLLPMEQQMERLNVLSTNVDMHKVPGLQVTVAGLTSTTDAVADRVAVVTLTGGTMTTNATIADLPLGKLVRDQIDKNGDSPSTSGPSTEQLKGVKLATVKEDGRWYVSLGYTVAESARTSAGKSAPDFDHPIPAPGADSPEAAVKAFTDSIASLDLAGAIGALAPGEFGALQDYGTLFVPDAQKSIDRWKSESKVQLSITQSSPKVEQKGDTAYVTFGSTELSATWTDGSLKVSVDAKGCATVKADVQGTTTDKSVCASDATKDTGVPANVQPILDRLKDLSVRAVVVREHGHWYVAPIRTVFDLVDQALGAFKSFDDLSAIESWFMSSITDTISGGTDVFPSDCASEVRTIEVAVEAYYAQNGTYPATLDELVGDYLMQAPTADGPSGAGTYDADTGTYTPDPSVGDCGDVTTPTTIDGSTDDSIPTETTAASVTPGDTLPDDTFPTELSPALKAFDALYSAQLASTNDPEKALQAMQAAGQIPSGARFFDGSATYLPAGVFTEVLGMQLDDGTGPACMILTPDTSISSFPIPCPAG